MLIDFDPQLYPQSPSSRLKAGQHGRDLGWTHGDSGFNYRKEQELLSVTFSRLTASVA